MNNGNTLPEIELQTHPFLKTLVSVARAEDTHGVWERKSDAEVLAEFIVTKEQRRALPIIGDPDPDVLHRIEQFYRSVGLRVEDRTGCMASPTMTMSHEGFGRLFITTGKLVAYSKTLRDVHRFGFETFAALGAEGEKIVAQAVSTIEQFPEVAKA